MKLTGIHHVTAISADAPGNRRFYVETLGMRLVKKTVNQDDTSAYHLFYADGAGSPGTIPSEGEIVGMCGQPSGMMSRAVAGRMVMSRKQI